MTYISLLQAENILDLVFKGV